MKIAILTQPLHTNYGGLLQAYAVQKILRDMGYQSVTLNLSPKHTYPKRTLYYQIRLFVATLVYAITGKGKWRNIHLPYNNLERNKDLINLSMRPFMERIMDISPLLSSSEEINSYCKLQGIDTYIVGSDQVWRPIYNFNIDWMFLGFIPVNTKAKRIALSASFGTSNWEFTEEETKRCSLLAKLFDAISVREISGVNLCRKYLGVNALQTIDPTMLLSPLDYEHLVNLDKENTTSMQQCVFSYILTESEEKKNVVNRISQILSLPAQELKVKIKPMLYASEKSLLKKKPQPVSQWLRAFQEANFVVTDSFHGTVFSILHHCPFVVVANNARGQARIETLLSTFKLKNRFLVSDVESVINTPINWEEIDLILDEQRSILKSFLENALEK